MQSLATGRITARATATATGQFHLTVRFSKHRNMSLVHLKHVGSTATVTATPTATPSAETTATETATAAATATLTANATTATTAT